MLCAQSLQLCPTLCDLMDCSPPQASLPMQILQARTLEWIAMPSSRGSSQPRHRALVCCIAGRFFMPEPPGKSLFIYYNAVQTALEEGTLIHPQLLAGLMFELIFRRW